MYVCILFEVGDEVASEEDFAEQLTKAIHEGDESALAYLRDNVQDVSTHNLRTND